MKLDNRTIARLPLPEDRHKADAIYFDETVSGFGIRFRRSGGDVRASWVCQYRSHGRTRRMKVGSVGKLSPEQARKAAREILAKVELGRDPQSEREAKRRAAVHTLFSIATTYLDAKKLDLRPASYRVTKLYLTGRAYFGPLHATAIGEITRADVAARIGAIARNSGTERRGGPQRLVLAVRLGDGRGACGSQPDNRDQSAGRSDAARPGAIRCGNCGDLDRSRRRRLWENRAAVVVDRGAPARNRRVALERA